MQYVLIVSVIINIVLLYIIKEDVKDNKHLTKYANHLIIELDSLRKCLKKIEEHTLEDYF